MNLQFICYVFMIVVDIVFHGKQIVQKINKVYVKAYVIPIAEITQHRYQ